MRRRDRLSRYARNDLAISIAQFPSNCKDAAGLRLGCIGDERGQQNLLDLIDYDSIFCIGKADGYFMSINTNHFLGLIAIHKTPPAYLQSPAAPEDRRFCINIAKAHSGAAGQNCWLVTVNFPTVFATRPR